MKLAIAAVVVVMASMVCGSSFTIYFPLRSLINHYGSFGYFGRTAPFSPGQRFGYWPQHMNSFGRDARLSHVTDSPALPVVPEDPRESPEVEDEPVQTDEVAHLEPLPEQETISTGPVQETDEVAAARRAHMAAWRAAAARSASSRHSEDPAIYRATTEIRNTPRNYYGEDIPVGELESNHVYGAESIHDIYTAAADLSTSY